MPSPAAYFLGIDVARTGLALVIMAGDGTQTAVLHRAYSASSDGNHDPQDWWRAARTGVKEILRRASLRADQLRCIGLTGDSDGLVTPSFMRTGTMLNAARLIALATCWSTNPSSMSPSRTPSIGSSRRA